MAFPTSYSSPYAVSPGGTALAADLNQYQPLAQNLEATVGVSSGTASPTGTHEQRLKYLEQGAGTVGGTPALTFGTANSPGTAYTRVRTDATLAIFSTTLPATQAIGDAGTAGTVAFAARRDHLHPMPSFGTPAVALGTAAAIGTATTLLRANATIVAFDTTVPTTQALGDAATAGTVAFAARRDHKHGMPTLALGDLPTVPAARVFYNSGAQSIGTATWTTLAFDSERYDTDTIHDTVTNNSRLTCKTAGKYDVKGHVRFAGGTVGARGARVLLNGGTAIAIEAKQTITDVNFGVTYLTVVTTAALSVNDYIELQVWQGGTAALNVDQSAFSSPEFMMIRASA